MIKNISCDRAKGIGYYINALSMLKNFGGKKLLSGVQIRLIVNELQKADFDDTYSITATAQKWMFINAVRKYSNLSPGFVEAFLS